MLQSDIVPLSMATKTISFEVYNVLVEVKIRDYAWGEHSILTTKGQRYLYISTRASVSFWWRICMTYITFLN